MFTTRSPLYVSTRRRFLIGMTAIATLLVAGTPYSCFAQENSSQAVENATAGTGRLIIETQPVIPPPPVFFTANADVTARVRTSRIELAVQLAVKVIQGQPKTLSLGLAGNGEVTAVQSDQLVSWSVRQAADQRFLDLQVAKDVKEVKATVQMRSASFSLPADVDLPHLAAGDAVGFSSIVNVQHDAGVVGPVTTAEGFSPLGAAGRTNRFQTTTGGRLTLALTRDGTAPASIEFVDTSLVGKVHPNGKSASFQFRGTAEVTEPNARIAVLSGQAAFDQVPTSDDYRLRLATANQQPVYELVFSKTGTFPVTLDFVATIANPAVNLHRLDFTVAASAVVPITLNDLESDLEFQRDQESVVPFLDGSAWRGFLPATGRAKLQWKTARKAGEGKLSFVTVGQIEARVGVGLLRQDHQLNYQILQGELSALSIRLLGPGEILDVQGPNIIGWKVTDEDDSRQLAITLSQAITDASQITVRSQTPLGAFPASVVGLRMLPVGALRHSGHLRLANLGSVRVEPTELSGLTQLSPDQFPGPAVEARQTFVYRFPAADHAFTVVADRIQPEVNVSELVLYQLAETDRMLRADIELDIREAPIREWDFGIPADYSVVSVTGANVPDYVVGSDVDAGRRNLKVIFSQDVSGRQLVTLQLERNEAAAAGDWILPRIDYPGAKTVLGHVGVIGAPGFRVSVGEADLLVEIPLSYFPRPTPNLQQAFRIREPGWSATMQVELLERSIQSDVFHLYSLSQGTVYGSALINYFVTGAPVSEWRVSVPATLDNVTVDGQDVRTWRREGDTLIVALHQPVMGPYTLLVSVEEKPDEEDGSFQAGQITPLDVQGERGYIQVVSPLQVELNTRAVSDDMLQLDPLELPAEFRLLSTAPPLGTWQYTGRPFELDLQVDWFQPGTTATQVIEFAEANSRVAEDGELVTDLLYYVKSRGQRSLRLKLPEDPVRLWEVSVNGQPVTARKTADATLIPLPGGTDPNVPVEVRLRLGKPTVDQEEPELTLPIVFAPVLKTHWTILGDEKRALLPNGGTVTPPMSVPQPRGFDRLTKRGLASLGLIALLVAVASYTRDKTPLLRFAGALASVVAISAALFSVPQDLFHLPPPPPLQLDLPVLAAGEQVDLAVQNVPLWHIYVSWPGVIAAVIGLIAIGLSFAVAPRLSIITRCIGIVSLTAGALLQPGGAPWFFALLAIGILLSLLVPQAIAAVRAVRQVIHQWANRSRPAADSPEVASSGEGAGESGPTGPATATIILFAIVLSTIGHACLAAGPHDFEAASSLKQQWQITDRSQLKASGEISLRGKPGDRFLLLKSPAVLTRFEGAGLRLTKQQVADQGLYYVISIPLTERPPMFDDNLNPADAAADFKASFDYQVEAIQPTNGVPVLTGTAAVQEIDLTYDEDGWEVSSPAAIRIEPIDAPPGTTQAKVLLGPGSTSIQFKPKARDVSVEETQFFVEGSHLYLPGPGVVDGRHRFQVRPSQGQVNELKLNVPAELNVSSVDGPIGSWRFDPEAGQLTIQVEPAQSRAFEVMIQTQRGLDPLPADVRLAPLTTVGANGEIGLLAIAFAADAQPEKADTTLSAVNLGDFDARLLEGRQAALHRVYRYGAEAGELNLRVAPVAAEVRVVSKQVLSLGDERVVLGVNFAADISRAGLFQLSFPLPEGLEVESLSGASLHHWAELSVDGQRQIILHLNGKTIGAQSFSLVLSGPVPSDVDGNNVDEWEIPRFELNEAARQVGELVVSPTTGIRLRTVSRQNVSEADPRTMGGNAQGALAFRLLQSDWNLVLGIEKLAPWVTGEVLHEITLREGQTRTVLLADFYVQNASVRTLQVVMPTTNEDEIKTLRASGQAVSDFVRTAADSNVWELRFKRRVIGRLSFRIEFERRGDRQDENEPLDPIGFPEVRQLAYYFAVRAGGRLEIEHDALPQGWQNAEWNAVGSTLREAGNRNAPAVVLRSVAPETALSIRVKRHSLAEALRLRVAQGSLTTILSPTGDQLTAVDVTMEVIQRSSLVVRLPKDGELISIFVNGESVHSIRQADNAWQFYILPGIDDRTAQVRFVYSVPGDTLTNLQLHSPQLNVPLENIEWHVVTPKGYELTDHEGSLELTGESRREDYDRDHYLSKIQGKRQLQAQQAAELLEQANQLLQAGEQTKARWALKSVANQYALDAASNEDARVQLENLQTQQAVVGLNTRRQRLYLDNSRDDSLSTDNPQLRQAAADNPILQQDQLNFRPQQLSQLLRGNTSEDNAILQQIASRLVRHQRSTVTAPQAIIISLPEEGTVYTFGRNVQVTENAPLALQLEFALERRVEIWQAVIAVILLIGLAGLLTVATTKR